MKAPDGKTCQVCHARGEIIYDVVEIDNGEAVQEAAAPDCGHSWFEIYEFKRIEGREDNS